MSGAKAPCRRCGHDRDGLAGHRPYAPGLPPGYCGTWACRCGQYKPESPFAWLLRWLHDWSRPRYDVSLPDGPPGRPAAAPEPVAPPGQPKFHHETMLLYPPPVARPHEAHPTRRGEPW